MGELGFVRREDAALMSEYVAFVETQLAARIDAARSFHLLAEAFPVRGSLA